MKINSLLVSLLSCILISGKCRKDSENCHYNIKVLNNSTTSIYIKEQLNYPDTSINNPNPALQGEYFRVFPGRNDFSIFHKDCLELVYQYYAPSDTIMFFVFDANVIENTNWEVVKNNYMILKRYDFSLNDLKNRNFVITYP